MQDIWPNTKFDIQSDTFPVGYPAFLVMMISACIADTENSDPLWQSFSWCLSFTEFRSRN